MTDRVQNTRWRLAAALRVRAGDIAYYGGVALTLVAIGFAAERYRSDRTVELETPVLPAIELSVPIEEEEPNALRAPGGAEILRAYSLEPVWNAGLRLWENHTAVDYRLEDGAVASLSTGVVRTVGKSGVYGGFVEVESGEYLLRYASIAPREELAPGDALAPGDPIGAADASMPGEAALGVHLHLELFRDDVCVDYAAACEAEP